MSRYGLASVWLRRNHGKKDPGLLVENKLSTSQCTAAATKANQILESKDRGIISRDTDAVFSLHSACARPHLEYCVQFKGGVETRKNPKDGHEKLAKCWDTDPVRKDRRN